MLRRITSLASILVPLSLISVVISGTACAGTGESDRAIESIPVQQITVTQPAKSPGIPTLSPEGTSIVRLTAADSACGSLSTFRLVQASHARVATGSGTIEGKSAPVTQPSSREANQKPQEPSGMLQSTVDDLASASAVAQMAFRISSSAKPRAPLTVDVLPREFVTGSGFQRLTVILHPSTYTESIRCRVIPRDGLSTTGYYPYEEWRVTPEGKGNALAHDIFVKRSESGANILTVAVEIFFPGGTATTAIDEFALNPAALISAPASMKPDWHQRPASGGSIIEVPGRTVVTRPNRN